MQPKQNKKYKRSKDVQMKLWRLQVMMVGPNLPRFIPPLTQDEFSLSLSLLLKCLISSSFNVPTFPPSAWLGYLYNS